MTRVVALLPSYFGGGERITNTLVEALSPHGFEFILITNAANASKRADVIERTFSQCVALDIDLAHYSPSTTARVADALRPLRADVLWLIGDEFADIPTLRAALNPGGRVIYHLHSVPFFQVMMKDSYHGNPADRLAYGKWFLTKHLREKIFRSYRRRYRRRTESTAAAVDAYITLCNGYACELAALYPALSTKFRAIYNPVAPLTIAPAADKKNEAVFLGRLTRADKRPDLLLQAFALTQSDGGTLKIIGDGPERANLEALARELKIADKVQFIGFDPNPAPHLDSASILCMTSAFEGWPTAIIEGMQHGLAPIAFNCSAGVAEILADGRGVLVEPFSITAYAAALSRLMTSAALRTEICSRHDAFLQKMDIDPISRQWSELFKKGH